jgi:hypothetical protein
MGREKGIGCWYWQWAVATAISAFVGAMWHVWWRPIPWWKNGYTLTPKSGLLVCGLGAAWIAVLFLWKRTRKP